MKLAKFINDQILTNLSQAKEEFADRSVWKAATLSVEKGRGFSLSPTLVFVAWLVERVDLSSFCTSWFGVELGTKNVGTELGRKMEVSIFQISSGDWFRTLFVHLCG